MSRYLALDLGTLTGWAISDHNIAGQRQIKSGEVSFKPGRFDGGGMRYLRFQSWLDEMHKLSGGITQIAFEEVRRHIGVDAAHAYGGFLSHLQSWCEANSIPYEGVPVGTIKKHATGKGNASKNEMITAMVRRGHHCLSANADNEADALAILYWMFDHATTSSAHQRPPLHREPKRRVPLDDLEVARRPVRRRAG